MGDLLTILETRLDERYKELALYITQPKYVIDWSDYMFRTGYLEAYRDIGDIIKEVRTPENYKHGGDIPDILEEI